MGYRSAWLGRSQRASRHYESVLYALDREVAPTSPIALLDMGVENGGSLEIWEQVLPEGSTVTGLDCDDRCAAENVIIADVTDRSRVRQVLKGKMFDCIIDDTRAGAAANVWPFLKVGGVLLIEGFEPWMASELIPTLTGGDSWLPGEEIIRVSCYPYIMVVEKRFPRVVPYLEITQGTEFPIISDTELTDMGLKRVVE